MTDQQRQAAEAIATGATTIEASQLAGVTRQTVSRWLNHDPEFQATVAELANAAVRATTAQLTGLADTAVRTLGEICSDPEAKHSDRVSAAKEILNRLPSITDDPPLNPLELLGRERYDDLLEQISNSL